MLSSMCMHPCHAWLVRSGGALAVTACARQVGGITMGQWESLHRWQTEAICGMIRECRLTSRAMLWNSM
ncbi:hypothetical protein HXX76_009988 [Chlamydomonas incerta]|uniref:Secreted protein n=1 Tax=Chlamydomonas incerta TaxID=51695 RepID=A0A835VWH9_CHLIN|nr:hypothetical protein HXX76_009988 [Chlamydomonas incerta]|eukprot:KAG2430465.1 hypothetical protein HXX76_009988 [Chlamydomonas incerta]